MQKKTKKTVRKRKIGRGTNASKVAPAPVTNTNSTHTMITLIQRKMALDAHAIHVGYNVNQIPLLRRINTALNANVYAGEDKIALLRRYITVLHNALTK